MQGVNLVVLLGHCGQDPEVRYSASGTAVANVSLATSSSWKDKETGDKQEKTEWHRLVAFGRTAEVMGEFVKKGTCLSVQGRLQTRKWKDKEDNDRWTTEIVVNVMQMVGGGSGGGQAKAESQAKAAGVKGEIKDDTATEEFDDDIPF